MKKKGVAFGVVMFVLLPVMLQAGQLDSFEEEATEDKRHRRSQYEQRSSAYESDHDGDCSHNDNRCRTSHLLLDLTGSIFDGMIASGSAFSALRMEATTKTGRRNPYRRSKGEPMLPIVRFDLQHQTTDSGLYANDVRMEFGYGPLGVQGRYTRFIEELAQDSLDYAQFHVLLRLSYTQGIGLNLGAGVASLDGNDYTTGSSFTAPMFLHLTPNIGFEFRPTVSFFNGNAVTESDSMLMLTHNSTSLSLGYRSLESASQQISGPYMGLSLRY